MENEDGTIHTVTYTLSRLTGRIRMTVNGDEYKLPAGFLGLKSKRREPFRLVGMDGEAEQAILVVDGKGKASLIFRGQTVKAEENA